MAIIIEGGIDVGGGIDIGGGLSITSTATPASYGSGLFNGTDTWSSTKPY